jgi:hypothetical protein
MLTFVITSCIQVPSINIDKERSTTNVEQTNKCWIHIVSTLLLLGICSLNVLLAHSIAVNTSPRS